MTRSDEVRWRSTSSPLTEPPPYSAMAHPDWLASEGSVLGMGVPMSPQEEATRLFAEHADRLRWFIRNRGVDHETARDLVQDCFYALLRAWERALENPKKFKKPEHPQAYLYKV